MRTGPLVLPAGVELLAGQRLVIEGLREAVVSGAASLPVRVDGAEAVLRLDLSPSERAVLGAGGLIAQIRAGGRAGVSGG